jgi:hypothetical protein
MEEGMASVRVSGYNLKSYWDQVNVRQNNEKFFSLLFSRLAVNYCNHHGRLRDKLGDADRKKVEVYGKERAKHYTYKTGKYICFRDEEAKRLYKLAVEAKVKKSYHWVNVTGGVANIGTSGSASFGNVVNSGTANFGTETLKPKKRGRPRPQNSFFA